MEIQNNPEPKIGPWNEWANKVVDDIDEHTKTLNHIEERLNTLCLDYREYITKFNAHIVTHEKKFGWVGPTSGIIAMILAVLAFMKMYVFK